MMTRGLENVLYYCPVYTEQLEDVTRVGFTNGESCLYPKRIMKTHQEVLQRYGTNVLLQRERLRWIEQHRRINLKAGRKGISFLHERCTLLVFKCRERKFEWDRVAGYFIYEQIAYIEENDQGYGEIQFRNGQRFATLQGVRSVREQFRLAQRHKAAVWEGIHGLAGERVSC